MNREKIKNTLIKGLENNRHSTVDLDNQYRIYCFIEDSLGFWNTYIHLAIDNNVTRQIDIVATDCDMCDLEMFKEEIDWLLDYYEFKLK